MSIRLLVSVSSAAEVDAAIVGGADIVDVKDPSRGALGQVELATLVAVRAAVGQRRVVTAALGDATSGSDLADRAAAYLAAGADLVKTGFAECADASRALTIARSATLALKERGLDRRLILVAYGDAEQVGAPLPSEIIGIAVATGAHGVLLDTADKSGPGILALLGEPGIRRWTTLAREAGLLTAVAGQLKLEELAAMAAIAPDIVGVRGAACIGGRSGMVDAGRVRALQQALLPTPVPSVADNPCLRSA